MPFSFLFSGHHSVANPPKWGHNSIVIDFVGKISLNSETHVIRSSLKSVCFVVWFVSLTIEPYLMNSLYKFDSSSSPMARFEYFIFPSSRSRLSCKRLNIWTVYSFLPCFISFSFLPLFLKIRKKTVEKINILYSSLNLRFFKWNFVVDLMTFGSKK